MKISLVSLLSVLVLQLNLYSVQAQSLAQHHNLMLEAAFNKKDYQSTSISEMLLFLDDYAQKNGFPKSNLDEAKFMQIYFENVKDWRSFYANLLNKGFITPSLHQVMVDFVTQLENDSIEPDSQNLLPYIVASKSSTRYVNLSASEKIRLEDFF